MRRISRPRLIRAMNRAATVIRVGTLLLMIGMLAGLILVTAVAVWQSP
jgi:hypothetical protein